jgi:hypothetical protein
MNIQEILQITNSNAHAKKAAEFVEAHGSEFAFEYESSEPDDFRICGFSKDGDYFEIGQNGNYHFVGFGGDSASAVDGGQGTYKFSEIAETVDGGIARISPKKMAAR